MSLLRIKELEAQLSRRDERIAELEKLVVHAGIQGYELAKSQAADIAAQTICDIHIPTGVRIYGTVAAKAIRQLNHPFILVDKS